MCRTQMQHPVHLHQLFEYPLPRILWGVFLDILFTKNAQSRFLKHRNTFTFWLSLCNFPWLDRKHRHQSKWKGCSWPPSQFVVGEGPWNFGIQILGGDVGAYMDYINHNKSLILNIVGPFSWHLNDLDCAVFILSLPKCCIEKEQILPCPFPPMN